MANRQVIEKLIEETFDRSVHAILRNPEIQAIVCTSMIKDEVGIVRQLKLLLSLGGKAKMVIPASIPMTEHDTVVYEMPLRYGRADAVVFHLDGSATVIEVKHGGSGLRSVLGGIGQASMYAAQLGQTKGALREVRRALAWSPLAVAGENDLVSQACESSGVIPVQLLNPRDIQVAVADMAAERVERILGGVFKAESNAR